MATEMRTEFEAYVQKLSTAICKDIFLEKMEKMCFRYERENEKYGQVSEKALLAGELLEREIEKADKVVKDIDANTKVELNNINQDILKMENSTKTLFDDMRELNIQSKGEFIEELSSSIENYKKEIGMILVSACDEISNKLAGVITPELLQQFIDKMEENTRESKEITSYINHAYKTEAEESFKKIISDNMAAQEKVNITIAAHVAKVLADLEKAKNIGEEELIKKAEKSLDAIQRQSNVVAKYFANLLETEKRDRDQAIGRQAELIKQIGPSDEQMNELNNHVVSLEQIVKGLEKQNELTITKNRDILKNYLAEQNVLDQKRLENQESLEQIVKGLERQNELTITKTQDILRNYMAAQNALHQKRLEDQSLLEKRADNVSWKIYMAFSNSLMICFFVFLVILQKPWEIIGNQYACIIAVVLLAIVLLVELLRKKLARGVVEIERKKEMKKKQQIG